MFRRGLGWLLVGSSLLLHLFTVYCFAQQPDRFTAFTIMPIWLWGGIGLLFSIFAFYVLRASLSLIVTGIWALTLLVGADEARVITNLGKVTPLPGPAAPFHGKSVIRVITLNCAFFSYGNAATDLAAWKPDIVLLQDIYPYQVSQIANVLYGGRGDYRTHQTNGLVTRWRIQREIRNPTQRSQQLTLLLPNRLEIEIVNVHLPTATTDLRLWKKSAWVEHRNNRLFRENELTLIQRVLDQTTHMPDTPVIFGGDFNAPATDVVHRQLTRDFQDSFATAGIGWGDTYQRRLPVLRIDYLYATHHFFPVRSRAVTTRNSDHRMVVTDFQLR
jgi:endonuclease/exonuclease/phosphatase (EEP) superfamily protein YafD